MIKDEVLEQPFYGFISKNYYILFILALISLIALYFFDFNFIKAIAIIVIVLVALFGYFLAYKSKKYSYEGSLVIREKNILVNDLILHLDDFDKLHFEISGYKGKSLMRLYTFNSETDGTENFLYLKTFKGMKKKIRFMIEYVRDEEVLRDLIKYWRSLGYDFNINFETSKYS